MVGRWMIIRCEGAETAAKNAAPSHAKSYLSRKTVLPLQGFKAPIGFCGFGYQLFILFLCKSLQIWCNCHTMIKSSPARSSFIMVAKIIDTARTNPWWFNNKQFYQTILDYLDWCFLEPLWFTCFFHSTSGFQQENLSSQTRGSI